MLQQSKSESSQWGEKLTSGRLPTRSIRNQGIKDATKNHVCKKPDMRADMLLLNPTLF